MPSTYMGQHHLETGLIHRNIEQHPSEDNVGKKSQNNNNISNENQIVDICNTLLRGRTPCILTQRGRHPLPLIRIFHGALPGMYISRNGNDNW